jgi:hypothetical protein
MSVYSVTGKTIAIQYATSLTAYIMFAVNRTASVAGWIRFLIVSMTTINGISIVGVPCGRSCSNIWLVFLIHPNSKNLIHNGSASVRVNVR